MVNARRGSEVIPRLPEAPGRSPVWLTQRVFTRPQTDSAQLDARRKAMDGARLSVGILPG